MTGMLSYPPNDLGARWFSNEVWRRVRQHVPDAVHDVVGKDPREVLQVLGETNGVSVVGSVPSIEPYFEAAHSVPVPVLTGAGTRVKIIVAMAAARPIVSTSLGAEGLEVEPAHHLVVEHRPPRFARALAELLQHHQRCAPFARDARNLANALFDSRAPGGALEHVLLNGAVTRQ